MSKYSFASIVPLIGGETIAMQKVFCKKPEYILTYNGFQANEEHLLKYYNNEVPYINLDEAQSSFKPKYVDVVNTVCPCAGLSSLSVSSSSDNKTNNWMYESAKYVLGHVRPEVFWGENAPRLASKMGIPVVENLRKIAKQNGYTLSLYRTKSLLHGFPQVRDRTFYFFWKGNNVPLLEYFKCDIKPIEEVITETPTYNTEMDEPINKNKPSENPYYRFVFEELYPNIDFQEFRSNLPRSMGILDIIEKETTYDKVAKWMKKEGYKKEVDKCVYRYEKLESGKNIMRGELQISSKYIGAFVGQVPNILMHPFKDRFITFREATAIMGMPHDFEMINPRKNANHICQNVPVGTASDMAREIEAVLDDKRPELSNVNYVCQSNHKQTYEIRDEKYNSLTQFF